ncbi:EAL domain-containing protein [Aestuariicella sp. G3-2]|uniref:bifunctional diguanylate cyclase/phosphodiesterase n=1 Tax=Pseudomaricurvus albidus TaxID=2842452 RepID=UPI001C0B611E|nr:EAL domain-containing protein [Aestuariicella albida]MBU3068338.1 EAL domain-containing protein [Aestuariicella albida]
MFFSLKWKAVILVLTILIILCGFLATLNSNQLHTLSRQQQQQQFEKLHRVMQGLLDQSYRQNLQLIDLIPLLSNNPQQGSQKSSLIQTLNQQWSSLQLNWGIESATLFDEQGTVLWQTPQASTHSTVNLSSHTSPHWEVLCESMCYQIVTAPVLNPGGSPLYLLFDINMADLLIGFSEITGADIGILIPPNNDHQPLSQLNNWNKDLLQLTHFRKTLPILTQLEQSKTFDSLRHKSSSVQIDEESYEVSMIPIDQGSPENFFAIIVNTSASVQLMQSSRRALIMVAIAGITISCFLLLAFLWKPITRLHRQAKLLPLLSSGEFQVTLDQLRKNRSSHWLKDEIDVLNETEEMVCQQLTEMRLEIHQQTRHLHNIAMYDSLTSLANRRALMDQLKTAIKETQANGTNCSLLFIDLDNFKRINDSMGHNAGDELLKIVAQRLRTCVRSSDFIARLGGDEFCVLITELSKPQDDEIVAKHILNQLQNPIKLRAAEVIVSASIGVVSAPKDGKTSEDLLQNADLAMYTAKALGRNKYQRFTHNMTDLAVAKMELENELRKALQENEFVLHYQPQFDLNSDKLIGFETLIRWQHPVRGLLLPDTFISLLEETGQILKLGQWILEETCRQAREWVIAGFDNIRIAVNISPRQLQDPDLPEQIQKALHHHQLSPQSLELELTETMLMEDIELTQEQLSQLQALGISIAIDDFGTGYSSLSYLKSLPLDILKIDRTFIKDLPGDSDDLEIVSAIIAMAHKLNLKLVAEGVETEAQRDILQQNNCDYAQGYLYSKPLPAEDARALLQTLSSAN